MPTHALPLTRAHGPDTRSASTAPSRRFGVPFPFPSANHLPPSFLRESQLRPLSVSAHDGLTFASSVSRYEVVTRTLAQRSGRLSRDNFEDARRRRAKGRRPEGCPSPDQARRPLAARVPLQPISHLAHIEQTKPRHCNLLPSRTRPARLRPNPAQPARRIRRLPSPHPKPHFRSAPHLRARALAGASCKLSSNSGIRPCGQRPCRSRRLSFTEGTPQRGHPQKTHLPANPRLRGAPPADSFQISSCAFHYQ